MWVAHTYRGTPPPLLFGENTCNSRKLLVSRRHQGRAQRAEVQGLLPYPPCPVEEEEEEEEGEEEEEEREKERVRGRPTATHRGVTIFHRQTQWSTPVRATSLWEVMCDGRKEGRPGQGHIR